MLNRDDIMKVWKWRFTGPTGQWFNKSHQRIQGAGANPARASLFSEGKSYFTARRYTNARNMLPLSVCLSATNRHCTKTAKHRITQTTPHDSPGTLLLSRQYIGEIQKQSPPQAPNRGELGSSWRISSNISLYLTNGHMDIVTMKH